ncbi:MAG: cysteine desulfurase [Acidobacteriia bacterium]|nr:cysteine desulfurase [Methyloceanibacter sp.]MCL6492604.1 cysteine desulfurase [Terriglobia bacterium]
MQPWRNRGRDRSRADFLLAKPRRAGSGSTRNFGASVSGRGIGNGGSRDSPQYAERGGRALVGRVRAMKPQPAWTERSAAPYDVARIRADFPILSQKIRGKDLVYLDNAASAQKPRAVIEAMRAAMETQYANVHRGLHWMSERTTEAYEAARDAVASFLNAADRAEVVFTRNSTEAINLVAHSYGRGVMQREQAVLISEMEHHSNIVPWQLLRDERGNPLRVVRVNDAGEIDLTAFEAALADGKVGLVAITHLSNVLGTVTPVEQIVRIAHAYGAKVLLDGSQAVVHLPVDVQALDADFYVFTGHKLYGPTGIGVLWARRELLEKMPPFLGGGEMISTVSFERTTWAEVPHKFEAGTPAILEAIGLKAAIAYVQNIGYAAIGAHEAMLTDHALRQLAHIPGLRILGQAQNRAGVISFTLENIHPHDVATLLDRQGIAVRAGHHCAEPLMHRFGVDGTARASFALYTTREEIDALAAGIRRVKEFFA